MRGLGRVVIRNVDGALGNEFRNGRGVPQDRIGTAVAGAELRGNVELCNVFHHQCGC